ncbi:hypothetical protein A2875_03220 [Candidatus Gottesmanbacteria bacterium RIFCSPHIGHO2_01_FULL_46_14]|uniref:Cohesin domain-containing protein n=2 Tax=Candidatus Gottesmaniibacteriota TaxID=1752720 RepID=A0A1F5ZS69_9BACT|nr:MAG: hypothetical protein A2875_03220 [Candidatus Gottesmanbacteria bacterium RIFCSPHIGHO2_01_FULL_46_14]OGG30371.1 MAG: hypothetical protein A2971_02120 [Candidatus Gottesmanbacteria bacterium RIFCSPLOWO2_01_FULL_46_21]
MKKLLLMVSILVVMVAIPVTIYLVSQRQELRKKAAPATTLAFSPASTAKAVGSEFSMEVHINTGDNQVIATELHIAFDPEKLEAITLTNGALFPNVLTSGLVEAGTASITVGAPSNAQPVHGQGTVAVVRFKALAPTSTPITVSFASTTLVSGLGEGSTNVLTGTTPGKITITGASTDRTGPAATPSASLSLNDEIDASLSAEASASAVLDITTPTASSAAQRDRPTIKGKAAPGSKVTLTIYSTPSTVIVTADANGNWVYTPQTPLEPGPHTIVATAGDGSDTATESFVVATDSGVPVSGSAEPTILVITLALILISFGIVYGKLSY